jgi:hypothetical protein
MDYEVLYLRSLQPAVVLPCLSQTQGHVKNFCRIHCAKILSFGDTHTIRYRAETMGGIKHLPK